METKNCTNPACEMINPQPLSEFHRHSGRKSGLTENCKNCNRKRSRKHSKAKKGKRTAEERKKKNKMTAEWVSRNPNYHKEYRNKNKHKIRAYYERTKERNTEKNRIRNKERRQKDPAFRAIGRARNRVVVFMRDKPKVSKSFGGSFKVFKRYIENLFQLGMTWDNYGLHGWHLDHNFPLAIAYKLGPEYFAKACHYKNLRPMWANKNLTKHDKIPDEFKSNLSLFLLSF